jgi:hypothetical protein
LGLFLCEKALCMSRVRRKRNTNSTVTVDEFIESIPAPGSRAVRQTAISQQVELTAEYVAAPGRRWMSAMFQTLPVAADDVSQDFGIEQWLKMMHDPQINSAVSIFGMAGLAQGYVIANILDDEDDPEYDLGSEVVDFCKANIARLPIPFMETLFEMVIYGFAYGHKAAEQVYEIATLPHFDGPRILLKALKTKEQAATGFAVDATWNVLGLVPKGVTVTDPRQIIPRVKFAIFAWNRQNSDPRGFSGLRPAYHSFWMKGQIYIAFMEFMARFAQPSVIGFTPPNAQISFKQDEKGMPTGDPISPEKRMLAELTKVQNGAAGAFPHGSDVKLLEAVGDGRVFIQAIEMCDHQINKAVIGQTLMTDEGHYQARAASQTHQDVFGIRVRYLKTVIASMIRNDILRPLVAYNYGEDVAARLTPRVKMGETEHQDFAGALTAVAAAEKAGYLHWTQYPALDAMIDLPQRDMNVVKAEQARAQAQAAAPDPLAPKPPPVAATMIDKPLMLNARVRRSA